MLGISVEVDEQLNGKYLQGYQKDLLQYDEMQYRLD
jgi:hypothetical protein